MTDPLLAQLDADRSRESGELFLDLITRYLDQTARGIGAVSSLRSPEELARRFDEPLPLEGRPLAEVVHRLEREVVADATRLTHPMYLGHQVSAPLPAAIWTEALISAINGSTAVREMAPSGSAIEHRLIRWFADLAGLGPEAGGTLTSGGTEASFSALLAARAVALPDAWTDGVGADPPVVVYGELSHYAVTRAIGMMGLGLRAGVAVPTRDWRMDTAALRATLDRLHAEGRRVLAVVATSGSTPTGSFDDLESIGTLCEERGLWLHVDGAHGASALFSPAHRHRVAGIHRARSLAWDPHKMMLLPLSAGVVLVRHERELDAAFAQRAPYLFHGADGEKIWDQGVRSFQCSRRVDAIKLWVALQRYGVRGIAAGYDRLCQTTLELHAALSGDSRFQVLHHPECNILCFRYLGRGERTGPALDQLNFDLRQRYNRSGAGWITTTTLGGQRVLRVTVMNPRTGPAEIAALLAGLAREGAALES